MSLLFLAILVDIPLLLLRGLAISWLWHWFVTPLGIAQIGIATAIGLYILVRSVVPQQDHKFDEDKSKAYQLGQAVSRHMLMSLLVFGMGYIVQLFV